MVSKLTCMHTYIHTFMHTYVHTYINRTDAQRERWHLTGHGGIVLEEDDGGGGDFSGEVAMGGRRAHLRVGEVR